MSITSAISKLQEAGGDPQKLTLATLDIVLSTREGWLRKMLETVAIPHWLTTASVAKLLEVDDATAVSYLEALKALPMVETFTARDGWNVHEATRLALRSHLAREEPERFRTLSMRAAETFQGKEPYQKVERIYHLLAAAPTQETSRGLNDLWYEWDAAGQHQSQQMLAVALRELLATVPLEPVSRARALLCYGMSAIERIPASQVEELARESVSIFQALRDLDSESDGRSLLGDALSIQGRREDALREYQEIKRILLELTKRDPGNADWLRDLSVSHSKVGGILEAEGRREEALREYQESKRILLELTKRDPGNAGWLRELSVSHNNIGGILQAEGRREEALREYQESKRIALELTKRDPSNAGWLHDLAVSHNRTAAVLSQLPEHLEDALTEHKQSVEIAERLVQLDPGRQRWVEDLRVFRAWVEIVSERLKGNTDETSSTA